jgi:hypothetical protein
MEISDKFDGKRSHNDVPLCSRHFFTHHHDFLHTTVEIGR